MPRYYDIDKIKKMIEAKAGTLIEGKEAFLYVAKWLDLLPPADVVPRAMIAEIFGEIEKEIEEALKSNYKVLPHLEFSNELYNSVRSKIDALRGIEGFIEALKKKYTEGE